MQAPSGKSLWEYRKLSFIYKTDLAIPINDFFHLKIIGKHIATISKSETWRGNRTSFYLSVTIPTNSRKFRLCAYTLYKCVLYTVLYKYTIIDETILTKRDGVAFIKLKLALLQSFALGWEAFHRNV